MDILSPTITTTGSSMVNNGDLWDWSAQRSPEYGAGVNWAEGAIERMKGLAENEHIATVTRQL